jgi:hypothetical protein
MSERFSAGQTVWYVIPAPRNNAPELVIYVRSTVLGFTARRILIKRHDRTRATAVHSTSLCDVLPIGANERRGAEFEEGHE